MKSFFKIFPLIAVFILMGFTSARSIPAIKMGENLVEGDYIGSYLEVLSEKDLFLALGSSREVEPVYFEKLLTGELHTTGDIQFRFSRTGLGFSAQMEQIGGAVRPREVYWGISDVIEQENRLNFRKVSKSIPTLNYRPHAYWLRFQVENEMTGDMELILELDKHMCSVFDLFYRTETGWEVRRGDFIQNLEERDQSYKNLALSFSASPGINTVYLRVDDWLFSSLPLRIWTENGFQYHRMMDKTLQKVIIGVFLFIFAFNLFVYARIRESSYLFLALMTIGGLVNHLVGSGVGFELIWPWDSRFGLLVLKLSIPVTYVFSLLFCREFIDTRNNAPAIDRYIQYTIRFLAGLIVLYLVLPGSLTNYSLGLNFLLEYFFYVPVFFAAIKIARSGNRSGIFLLIGIFLHYLSLVEWALSSLDVIPFEFRNYIHIKGASFLIILTLGLTHKINVMQSSLNELQQSARKKTVTEGSKQKIQALKEYLRKNYSENYTRENLARTIGLSPDHLSRMFKQETGEKISDFVNQLRTEKAAELLVNTNDKIISVAYEVGFKSLRTFNKVFLEIMGRAPSEYRKQQGENSGKDDPRKL